MIVYTCPQCGGDLIAFVITTLPPITGQKCTRCSWRLEEPQKEIVRIPFEQRMDGDGDV